MSQQLAIRIEGDLKEQFYRASRLEGKTASEKMRELIEAYIQKADISQVVDDLWGRVEKKIAAKGITEEDVVRMVMDVRSGR